MAKKKPVAKKQVAKLTAKCVSGHKYVVSQEQLERARNIGCLMCECGMPAFLTKAEVKNIRI